jgi:hypothetical protein
MSAGGDDQADDEIEIATPIRLPRSEFEALAAGAGADASPALEATLDVVRAAVCTIGLRVQDADGRRLVHEGWVGDQAAVLLMAGAGELCEVVTMHPAFLPEAVARITALGPRPEAPGMVPLRLAQAEIDGLTAPDRNDRAIALERLAVGGLTQEAYDGARALASGLLARWELMVRWTPARGSAGRRGLHVIDSAAGLWLLEPVGADLLAWPVTSTAVWRLLIRSLPGDHELRV